MSVTHAGLLWCFELREKYEIELNLLIKWCVSSASSNATLEKWDYRQNSPRWKSYFNSISYFISWFFSTKMFHLQTYVTVWHWLLKCTYTQTIYIFLTSSKIVLKQILTDICSCKQCGAIHCQNCNSVASQVSFGF